MGDFTILKIHGQRDWENPKGGTIRYFDLELEGAGRASLGQRSDKPDPKVGDTLLGYSIEETDKGKKVKKEYVAGGGGGKDWPTKEERAKTQRSIERQSARRDAIEWVSVKGNASEVDTDTLLKLAEKFEGWAGE